MLTKPLAALFLLLFLRTALASGLPVEVLQALKGAQIPTSNVAVLVQAVDAGTPLVAHHPTQAMNPASVMKLLTTYAALDLLGPAYTWKTTAWCDAAPPQREPLRAPRDGVLDGNFYLKGSGDPRFTIEQVWTLLRQVRTRGIQHITGDIVLDRSTFNTPSFIPGAFDDKPMRPYNVGPNGLLINFQALRFSLLPDNPQPKVFMETPSEGLHIDNRLRAGEGQCGSDWKDRITTRLIPEADGHRLEFTGTYSPLCGERTLNLAPLPADSQSAGLIRALWKELGGTLAGQVRDGIVPNSALLLTQTESPPLAEIVRDINKFSNNVMARQVFLTLGNDAQKETPLADTVPATPERARQRVTYWLAGHGLHFPELALDNGSGLSRSERISAASLNQLLQHAWRNPVMPEFVSSMPIVGIDGTMRKRLGNSPATGRAHIKTGTLDGVKTAAGYVQDTQGRRHVVVFLINHPRSALGGPAIDALLIWVAQRQHGEKIPAFSNE